MSATDTNTTTRIGKCEPNASRPDDGSYAWEDGYRLARPLYLSTDNSEVAASYVAGYTEGAKDRIADLLREGE